MKTKILQSPITLIILAGAMAAGAGVTAAMVSTRAIDSYAAKLLEERRFSALIPERSISRPGTFEEGVARVRTEGFTATARFFKTQSLADLPANWQLPEAEIVAGAIVSADGWVLVPPGEALTPGKFEAVVRGKRYAVKTWILGPSGVGLVQLADAEGLPIVDLGASADLRTGDVLLGGDMRRGVEVLNLVNARARLPGPVVLKAEERTYGWVVDKNLSQTLIWSGSGEIVGLSSAEGQVVPIHALGNFISEGVRGSEWLRAGLGAYVADLQFVLNAEASVTGGRQFGAVIMAPTPVTRAVVKGGPAEAAGLQARDILLAMDGVTINADQPLADILLSYRPGEVANVTFLRAGEVLTLPVTLSNQADLLY
jgi:hypothetical protein